MKSSILRKNNFPTRLALTLGATFALSINLFSQGITGETVVAGEASFQRSGADTTIVAANNTAIEYQTFNVLANSTVEFIQPNQYSFVLNSVTAADNPSLILGSLISNGNVILANPSGVLFGDAAYVNASSLFAVGGELSVENFLSRNFNFTNLSGAVNNQGFIEGSSIHLIGREVINSGTIVASGDIVSLTAGDEVLLGQRDGSLFVSIESSSGAAAIGVDNSGTIEANNGQVFLGAGDLYSLAIRHSGVIESPGVHIEGGDGGIVDVSGSIDATGDTGGNVKVLGEKVGLFAGANIDASGSNGGGEVLIGGDFQGSNPDVRNAERTYVAESASIRVDAIDSGDGGRVIVWADDVTRFNGFISAKGGAEGGDGGFVETSGKGTLEFNGNVDTSAANGAMGSLLLDPTDVVIVDGAGPGNDDGELNPGDGTLAFGDGSVTSTISENTLEAVGADTNISIQATNSINIEDLADDALTLATDGTVDFLTGAGGFSMDGADDSIAITGTGSLNIDATNAGAGGDGSVQVSGISSAEGDITLKGTEVTVDGAIVSTSGTLRLEATTGTVDLNSSINLDGGNFVSDSRAFDGTGSSITANNVNITTTDSTTILGGITGAGNLVVISSGNLT
ncbi:MAG: two-partner secretion domain-containing protein, partial [Verrucomicrobiia bacterium]